MGLIAKELAWLLEEAARGNLDASGGDYERIEEFMAGLVNEVAAEVLRRIEEKPKQQAEVVPVLPMPFDPWEHLRPPVDATEPR